MATLITGVDISQAWLLSAEALEGSGRRASNLFVVVKNPSSENTSIRRLVDAFFEAHAKQGIGTIDRIADTIFPMDLYGSDEPGSADRLFERREALREFSSACVPNGNYFDRFCAYPGKSGAVNQLGRVVKRLRSANENNRRNSNVCEIAVSSVDDELLVQEPAIDTSIMGFPCLSHVSVTLINGRIDLTATYRSQDFTLKAYGNLLGLSRLAQFLSDQSGFTTGEVVSVATCATLPADAIPHADITRLLRLCREVCSRTGGN